MQVATLFAVGVLATGLITFITQHVRSDADVKLQAEVRSAEIANAVSAASRDPRFDPITADELPLLEINVDVLGEPEDIPSADMLDVKRYGVIVTNGYRRGLLLPDLDGVDTVEDQIDIARRKAGIPAGEPLKLQRFEVIRHF